MVWIGGLVALAGGLTTLTAALEPVSRSSLAGCAEPAPACWTFCQVEKLIFAGGKIISADETIDLADGKIILAVGKIDLADGKIISAGGKIDLAVGEIILAGRK